MNDWPTRLLLYVVVVFLIMIVYGGQRCDNAAATLRMAGRMTLKGMGYTAMLVAAILLIEVLFID